MKCFVALLLSPKIKAYLFNYFRYIYKPPEAGPWKTTIADAAGY